MKRKVKRAAGAKKKPGKRPQTKTAGKPPAARTAKKKADRSVKKTARPAKKAEVKVVKKAPAKQKADPPKYSKDWFRKKKKEIDLSTDVLETYTGVYSLAPNFNLTVTVEDGKLMLQATGQAKFQVFPESKTKFFLKVVDAQISFILSKDGKVDHLILHQGGIDQKAFPRKAIEVSSEVLESYVGVYKVPSTNSTLMVTVEDGKLMVGATGEAKKQVFPESKTRFFYKEMESIQISFVPDEDGKINRLIVHMGSKEYEGFRENERIPE